MYHATPISNKSLLIIALCTYTTALYCPPISHKNIPEPYRSIIVLPFDGQGWYGNARQIEAIFKERPIRVVIEVGSWIGASTRHIASLLPQDGKLYAIDHWLGSSEHQPGQSAWTPALSKLYQQFLSNIIHSNLTHIVIPIRMTSIEASRAIAIKPDLIYIDAAHETAAVYADLVAWWPFVQGHGILCGDDWGWPSVAKAVQRFAHEKRLTIYAQDNFWRLQE